MTSKDLSLHLRPRAEFLELFSSIGTWLAVLLAAIALIGIVAPWLALRATRSDKNRAFNLVHDRRNIYMTAGWRIPGTRIRVLRRARVPDLAPGLSSSTPAIIPLLPAGSFSDPWTLKTRSYIEWNNGWTMFCALVQAHYLPTASRTTLPPEVETASKSQAPRRGRRWFQLLKETLAWNRELNGPRYEFQERPILNLANPEDDIEQELGEACSSLIGAELSLAKGGLVEVINSQSAMVISKYWILAIGLLGKYTSRTNFMSFTGGLGERHWGGYHASSEPSFIDDGDNGSDDESSVGMDLSMSSRINTGRGNSSGDYYLISSRHGLQTLTNRPLPEIYGFTGRFKSLGWHRNTLNYRNLLTFYPRSLREVYGARIKNNASSILTQFWLANGFILLTRSTGARSTYELLSFRDPKTSSGERIFQHSLPQSALYALEKVSDYRKLPPSIWKPAMVFGFPFSQCEIYEWEVIKPDEHPTAIAAQHTNNSRIKLVHDSCSRVTEAFLSIKWDDWGYLILSEQLEGWLYGLEYSKNSLKIYEELILAHLRATHRYLSTIPSIKETMSEQLSQTLEAVLKNNSLKPEAVSKSVPPKHIPADYSPANTSCLVHLDSALNLSNDEAARCLRPFIGLAFLKYIQFREDVMRELQFKAHFWGVPYFRFKQTSQPSRYDSPSDYSRDWIGSFRSDSSEEESSEGSSHFRRETAGTGSPITMPQMPSKISTYQLLIEAGPNREFVTRTENFRYVKSERVILRDRHIRRGNTTRVVCRRLPLSHMSLQTTRQLERILNDGPSEVTIRNQDIISMCVSAMIRCTLWHTSLDSHDLFKFVNDLDAEIWVM